MSDGSRPRGYIPPPPSFSTAPDLSASIPPPPAPSFSSAPDIRDVYRDEESDRERRKRKKHKRDRSRERRRSSRSPTSKRRKSRSPSRRHRRSHEERRTRSPTRLTEKLDTGMVFVIDKYGDYDNLKYGGNNASSVPAYHRYGGGRILGLSPMYRIDTSSAKTSRVLSLTIRKPRRMPRYTDPDYAILENDRAVKRIKIKPGKAEPDPFGQLFIPLDVPSKKSGLGEEMISSGVDYRSIEGPKVKKDESDIDENDSDKEEGESFDEYVRRRKIEFEKELSEDPHNWQLWLDYIAFQDESAQGLNTGVQARFKANKSSLNEVKMSMFQKAFESNPDNEDLLLGYLKLGSETWDTLTLLREWDTVLKKKPESIRLWAEYINLRQTNFASFSFTQCLKVFEDCIHTLNKVARRLQMKRKVENNYEGREEIESIMVYVLLRACLFMKQAGYHERAFGALQAQVEFSLFRPQVFEVSTEISFDDMIAEFDEFWDSEVPRFGERNANGWKEFYNQKSDEAPSNQDENQISQVAEDEDDPVMLGLRDWVQMEEKSERARRLPLRISTVDPELVDNDPFLVTLSDDLHGFLFNLTTQEARQSLIYSIFVFLGLPFTPPGVGTNTHFCIDTFTHNDINMQQFWPADDQVPQLITYIDGVPMEPEHYTGDTKPYGFPPSYPVGLTELFAEPGQWFNCLSSEPLECSADTEFCRNAFEQLLKRKWDNHLALCYLSLESRLSYKGAKSLAKRLLNDQRTNLVLWNAYAQMEKSQGHIKEARKVYRTALATYRTFPEQDQEQVSVIFHMFADLELQQNCREEALKILVSISNDKPYDPALPITNTQILKAQKYYEQKTAQLSLLLSSEQESRSAFHYTACLALLQYLTQNVAAACRVYDTALEYIRDRQAERGFESEMLWVSKVCFLYRHAISGQDIHQPDEMRNTLEKAFSLFPNNTIFIGIYAWNESRLRIMNRVRAMFARSLHEHPNIILWLSSLYDELHRRRPYDVNQVRSSFDAAVEQSNTRSSVLLWKLYIEHEVRRNEIERAKRLFYRSLQACPWSKELYLLGIRLLTRYLSEKERHEIVSLMMEKEIRLRKEIPEELFS